MPRKLRHPKNEDTMVSKASLKPGLRLCKNFRPSDDSPVCWKDYYDAALMICDYTLKNYTTYTRTAPPQGSRDWPCTSICMRRTMRIEPHVNAKEYEEMFNEIVDLIIKYRKD